MNFADVQNPIMARIGFDMARIRELGDAEVQVLWAGQAVANAALVAQLTAMVGEETFARTMVRKAMALSDDERRRRCEQLAQAVEAGELPRPRALAAHIALGVLLEEVYATEAGRRALGTAMN